MTKLGDAVAWTAARVLARFSARVDPGGVTVSAEDEQGVRHWVFGDPLLPKGRGRCLLPAELTSKPAHPCAAVTCCRCVRSGWWSR
ncbi:hypothetical protein ACTMSW_17115 [Micromonospora sp. BQ11]|uniref:hypothetical protein n=1 Tax=Micromonospora sp. BQ11 TaxID=3452212 RepID=UPI003F8C0C40